MGESAPGATAAAVSPDAPGTPGGASAADTRRARRRRRKARRVNVDTSIPSPCVNVCQVDDADGLCIGCRRHVDEIRDWLIMTAAQKTAVLARIEARKAARNEP